MYIKGTEEMISVIIVVIHCAKVAFILSVFITFCSASHNPYHRPDPFLHQTLAKLQSLDAEDATLGWAHQCLSPLPMDKLS